MANNYETLGECAESEKAQIATVEINQNNINRLIYIIRGQQVMLDSDLAMLYQVETKILNRSVNRNINRFPEDFCFQLTSEEYLNLKCEFGTSSLKADNTFKKLKRFFMTDKYMMRLAY